MATAALFGIGPALQATRGSVHESLKEGTQGSGTGRRHNGLQNALIVVEVGLALVLLVGASLFVRTFVAIDRTNLGYDPARIMTMRFYLPGSRYDSASARLQAVRDVLRQVAAVPGVDAATVSDLIPLDDEGGSSGEAVPERAEARRVPSVAYAAVTGDWFATLGVRLTAGRTFLASESQSGASVAVINEAMAKVFWRGESPIGRRFRFVKDSSRTWYEVIGVAPDVRTVKLDEDMGTPPTAFLPPRFVSTRDYGLMVRTRQPPASLTRDLARAIHAADPVVPVFNTWTMDEVRYLSVWMYVLWGTMFGVFGTVALVLATIGVYGVIHYGVAQRTREIGVRVALGAQRHDVIQLVLGRALSLVALGIAAGLVGAFGVTRVIESLLIGVSPTDPTSFLAMVLVLGGVAVVASCLPARRAMRVDPTVALRQE
jgi:predicted permease